MDRALKQKGLYRCFLASLLIALQFSVQAISLQELTLNTESVLQGARKNVTEWQLASANPLAANSYFVSNDLHEIWLVNDGRLASKPLLAR